MSKIWFTADQHFNHTNIIKYCNRPFEDVARMNETLIANWNARVQLGDDVYVLGDFVFGGNFEDIVSKLNGEIGLVLGDHDRPARRIENKVHILGKLYEFRSDRGISITLCHYALRVWPKSHYNSWCLYGHSHGRLAPEGKSFDIGVDVDGRYAPYSFADIEKIMEVRPDNFNLVRR